MLRPEAGALTPDDEDDDESSVPNYPSVDMPPQTITNLPPTSYAD